VPAGAVAAAGNQHHHDHEDGESERGDHEHFDPSWYAGSPANFFVGAGVGWRVGFPRLCSTSFIVIFSVIRTSRTGKGAF
jgi:hypothetical protein